MSTKIFWIAVLLGVGQCEPPSTSYGTPLGAPINDYGNSNNYDRNNGNGHHNQGDHGDHGDQGEPKAYEFGYQVKDEYSGNNYNRKEASDGNQVRGEYRVQLPDGRTQIVTYYADWQTGFHADVKYEGEAQYPDQYNTYNNNGQYGAPNYQQNNGYNGGSGTSSVSIKDYSSGSGSNGYNSGYNGYNSGSGYDSYSGNVANKARPGYEYGAP